MKSVSAKKVGVTERPRSLSPGKAAAMATCPIICSFYYLARARSCTTWHEFSCAVRMRRDNWRERP